jgi:nitronate monooxygenase
MAGASDVELAAAVAEAGGLGSLPCAMLSAEQLRQACRTFRQRTDRPLNLNFFCHPIDPPDPERERRWRELLAPYYIEFGLDPATSVGGPGRRPFDDEMCDVVLELRPEVISFHFGLPSRPLLDRVRSCDAKVMSSATTVEEARWLESAGCDAIIVQGAEAGGHRAMFLTADLTTQVGTIALVPQVVDAVKVPVIASGGIVDARGIVAAFALGASAVQLGTAYLRCPECRTLPVLRRAVETVHDDQTVMTNVITGRPARAIVTRLIRDLGPVNPAVPGFPRASDAIAPLRSHSEKLGSGDFSPLWCGQAGSLTQEMPAGLLTKTLATEAIALMKRLAGA